MGGDPNYWIKSWDDPPYVIDLFFGISVGVSSPLPSTSQSPGSLHLLGSGIQNLNLRHSYRVSGDNLQSLGTAWFMVRTRTVSDRFRSPNFGS